MSASEFAFLALGLILGLVSGAALIEVLRARPGASREIRLTVSPNAIHSRMSSTLADPGAARVAHGPALGGPGDRRSRDELVATGEPAATGRRSVGLGRGIPPAVTGAGVTGPAGDPLIGTSVRPTNGHEPTPAAVEPAPTGPSVDVNAPTVATRPAPFRLSPTTGPSTLVAVPMSLEPDPVTAALRASAAPSTVARAQATGGSVATAERG
ncbi:MAG: hypothetical protein H0U52_12640, partial [Chloroflexi bacterium]|nr:hypothetical protein [Chloroflexota bacterium]